MLYTKLNDKSLTGKPLALCMMPRNFKKMTYIMGFSIPILEFLSQEYDLILITGKEGENEDLYKYGQVWGLVQNNLIKMKDTHFKRATEVDEDSTNWEYNREILISEFAKCFGEGYFNDLKKILIFDPIDFILPLTSYVPKKDHIALCERQNEFHDAVDPDDNERTKIAEGNQKVGMKFDARCSILAFGTHFKNVSVNLVKYAFKEAESFDMAYAFINDPAFYTPIFEYEKIPFKAYYFQDDKRGTRDFYAFPLGELQHIVWDKRNKKKDLLSMMSDETPKKDRSVFFAGTIFQEKGGRVDLWNRYLKDLRVPDAGLYIPLRSNGILHTKGNNDRYLNKVKDVFTELHEEVINHPHYEGHLVPDEYEDQVARYRYGILFRCVSHFDSLNFRPILYARLRILPLLDPQYDPAALQIPPYIQSKLVVQSHEDIQEKIAYFDKNFEEREQLLDELEDLFSIKTFEKNWKSELQKYI
jgi:hypothetical protein